MSEAMKMGPAMPGSAPSAENSGASQWLMKLEMKGMAAMVPATGMKIGPMLCSPARNSLPSSDSASSREAMAPITAQAMMT
ncbi:hypothetical protein D3C85_1500230 [compost metagenome]